MDFSALLQGIITNWLSELIVFGGGLLLAVLKAKAPKVAEPLLYGVVASSCIALVLVQLGFFHAQPLTALNVEPTIRKWMDDYHASVTKAECGEGCTFFYGMQFQDGGGLGVGVATKPPFNDSLTLRLLILTTPLERVQFEQLKQKRGLDALIEDIKIEAARSKLSFVFQEKPELQITIQKHIPIGPTLTEAAFVEAIEELRAARVLMKTVVDRAFRERGI